MLSNQKKTAISVFCFMLMINFSVILITGFNGLTDIQFVFYTVGLICSIKVLDNNPFIVQEQNYELELEETS